MLRAARFTSQLRFEVAPPVRAAMVDMAGDLARITAERIRDELVKLMCGADPVAGLRLLVDTGLADVFLPELAGLRLEERYRRHVNRRTGRRAGEYFEDVLVARAPT